MIKLPSPLPAPAISDYSAEAQFIRLYNEAIELATLLNTNALAVFQHKCEFWLRNYEVYQNNKLPIPEKPAQMCGWIVDVVNFEPEAVLSSTELLAEPCPDPQPEQHKVVAQPADPVGEHFGGVQPFYRVMTGDRTPIGGKFSSDRGVFVRSQSATPCGMFQYWLLTT